VIHSFFQRLFQKMEAVVGGAGMIAADTVPVWLVGPVATTAAAAVLTTTTVASLALTLAGMRSKRLESKVRKGWKGLKRFASRKQTARALAEHDVGCERCLVAPRSKHLKRKSRRPKIRKFIKSFFIAEKGCEPQARQGDDLCNPFELDNSYWLNPSGAQPELSSSDVFSLGDELWQLPAGPCF